MSGPGAWHRTLCPYCGVGCGLLALVEDGTVVRTKGDPAHPANFGDICAKAVHLPPVLRTPDRLLHPQLRVRRDGSLEDKFLAVVGDDSQERQKLSWLEA